MKPVRTAFSLVLLATLMLSSLAGQPQSHSPDQHQQIPHRERKQALASPLSVEAQIQKLIDSIDRSGRLLTLIPTEPFLISTEKTLSLLPPGQPPVLAFRYFEGKDRHRFGNLDLVVDDAGH